MKNVIYIILSALMLLSTAGCGSRCWYNKDKSFTQCKVDYMNCRVKAGQYVSNTSKISNYSIKIEKECMKCKGYRLYGASGLGENIKIRKPDPIFKEKYGIAGKLECDMISDKLGKGQPK